jgi:predicted nucleic acid-binding protein
MRVFLDSDVVISSLLSDRGAAFFLVNSNSVKNIISSLSKKELLLAAKRMSIKETTLLNLINSRFEIVKLEGLDIVKNKYDTYVFDPDDAHIVAGAKEAKADFLITYNIKDYNIEKIKSDFGVIVLTPGHLLQYLRSKE